MDGLITIIPIFSIIFLGWFARARGFIPAEFIGPANRLVYYLAIPAMIFRAIYRGSFHSQFDPWVLVATLVSVLALFVISWAIGNLASVGKKRMGTFVQSTYHGNLGYVGLAVAYYYLGEEGLVKAGILAGFIMIFQNLLSVIILVIYSQEENGTKSRRSIIMGILGNPVILSAMVGILVSLIGLPIPDVLDRSLKILGGMALPLALLLIGAALSFDMIRHTLWPVLLSASLKLVLLPACGYGLFRLMNLIPGNYVPGLILLSAPTATIAYVMAKEMKNDTDFAVATISTSTLLSAFSFTFWIAITG